MLPFQQPYNSAVSLRYRRLAGPFADGERTLYENMTEFLRRTGARIVTVGEPEGVCVWRLGSECETLEDTAHRLRRNNPSIKNNRPISHH